jgi:hypothetical protein
MSTIDEILKLIGIAAIGVIGIGLVLSLLSAMCILVAVFTFPSLPDTPVVTIGPVEGPSVNSVIEEIWAIPAGHYESYSTILSPGAEVNITISTNGSPVDVMVMDSANYGKYVTALNGGGKWQNFVSEKSIVRKSFEFIAPGTDRYYVIVDNTRSPEGGAEAGEDVNVRAIIAYI